MSKLYASKVIAIAAAEIGYKEKATNSQLDSKAANAGHNNYTKYARDFDQKYPNWYNGKKNGFAWCDMFVDWCFLTAFGYSAAIKLLCQPERSAGAGCTYSMGYYKNKGQFHTSNPKPGDQIFFRHSGNSGADHTGIVEKVDKSYVYTIEGNSSDQVVRRTYSLKNSTIVGYGRPAFDAEASGNTGTKPAADTKPQTGTSNGIKIGDVVQFTGNKHYTSSYPDGKASACKGGKAKVTAINKSGAHPYHLIAVSGGRSNVYGWVNASDVTGGSSVAAQSLKVGDKVKCNAGVTKFSDGTKMASFVPSSMLYVRAIENGGKILLVSTEKTKAIYTGRVNASDVHKV